jgi:hypothetical protein
LRLADREANFAQYVVAQGVLQVLENHLVRLARRLTLWVT